MKKFFFVLTAAVCAFLCFSCAVEYPQEDYEKNKRQSAEVFSSSVEIPTPAPNPTSEPTPTPEPTPEPTPTPYTQEWLEKYAPASIADYSVQVGNGTVDEVTSYPVVGTYRLTVDYHNQCVYAYSRDKSGDYAILERVMICTTGGNGNWTPEGVYMMGKNRYRFGEFKKLGGFAQYWSQMEGSFYFHSILYNARSADTLVKSSYNNLGTPCSHGCIRLLVPDAQWIYENCAPGTICEVTTEIPKDPYLKAVLKNGSESAMDITKIEE